MYGREKGALFLRGRKKKEREKSHTSLKLSPEEASVADFVKGRKREGKIITVHPV